MECLAEAYKAKSFATASANRQTDRQTEAEQEEMGITKITQNEITEIGHGQNQRRIYR